MIKIDLGDEAVICPLVSKESALIFTGKGTLLSGRREFKIFVVSKIASEVEECLLKTR